MNPNATPPPKPRPLAALTIGLDVVSNESSLPRGAVRRARNIVIQNNGNWGARPGFTPVIGLDGAHSLWRSAAQTRVLCAAGDTLYDVDLANGAAAPLFVGLLPEQPVEYDDVGADVWFTCAGLLRKILPDGTVRRPGVVDTLGNQPTLSATTGDLYPGTYSVAYSFTSDLGEESALSSVSTIELATIGGIVVSGIPTDGAHVVSVNLYATTPGGSRLYRNSTAPLAATVTLAAPTTGRPAEFAYLQPMPGGEFVRHYRGRVYTASGKWLWFSTPLNYGLTSVREGFMTFGRTMTMLEPVQGGIFIGLREKVILLRGNGPEDFEQVLASERGALPHTSTRVAADFFNPDVTPNRDLPVAAWLTADVGLAIGRADGSITYPQAGRLKYAAGAGRALFAQLNGIKQGVFCLEAMSMGVGGAVDTTI